MSIECGICERDLRGGHDEDCPRHPNNHPVWPRLKPRPEVRAMAELMERILEANDHKGGWQQDSIEALFRRAQEELDELRDAIVAGDGGNICKEAADVANFMMMIADNTTRTAISDPRFPKAIPSHRQLSIAFGHYLAGYRPGEDMWNSLDDEALQFAYYGDESAPLPFDNADAQSQQGGGSNG